jgi:hypothetical protein
VSFNGVEATVTVATNTSLTVIVPTTATTGKISIQSGCNIVSSTEDFSVVNLSTNSFSYSTINIYPNPTTGIVNISSTENSIIDKIEIVDVLGKTVATKTGNTSQVDISHLSNGMYVFKIYSGENVSIKKIIKE